MSIVRRGAIHCESVPVACGANRTAPVVQVRPCFDCQCTLELLTGNLLSRVAAHIQVLLASAANGSCVPRYSISCRLRVLMEPAAPAMSASYTSPRRCCDCHQPSGWCFLPSSYVSSFRPAGRCCCCCGGIMMIAPDGINSLPKWRTRRLMTVSMSICRMSSAICRYPRAHRCPAARLPELASPGPPTVAPNLCAASFFFRPYQLSLLSSPSFAARARLSC